MNENIKNIYFDILHIYLNGTYLNRPYSYHKRYYPKILLALKLVVKELIKFFGYSLLGFYFENKHDKIEQKLKEKKWLFIISKNNYDSVSFIKTRSSGWEYVGDYGPATRIQVQHLRYKSFYLLPFLLFEIKRQGYSLRQNFYLILSTVGLYEAYIYKLKKLNPKIIVFSNDHTRISRALLLAAKEVDIPTVYIQHASVTEKFPPIRFDLSLLDGEDTYEKYRKITGSDFHHQYIGMPKFDQHLKFRREKHITKVIGVSFNIIEEIEHVYSVLIYLKSKFTAIEFIFRPHPGDERDFSKFYKLASISDSKRESVFDYLKKIDIHIAGDSGIHLESTILNIPSVFYSFFSDYRFSDNYGFIKRDVVFKAVNLLL